MKKLSGKISLNRETLRNLDETRLQSIAGGATTPTQCAQGTVCLGCPSIPIKLCATVLCN
jgi:hypothetical protein